MRRLKILLAHNHYLIGGGERQVFAAELSLLRNHGHEVDVYIEDNQRIAELGRLHTAARTIWSTETYRNIRNRLRGSQFDVVHVHNFFPLISPSIYYAAHAERIPVVQTLHNFRLLCSNGLLFRDGFVCEACVGRVTTWPGIIHACYRDSRSGSATVAAMLSFHRAMKTWDRMIDTYIALTEFSRQKFIEGGLPQNKIWVKPNFITRKTKPGSGQGNFALFVGRLAPEKGVETLLAAWRLLGDKVPLKIIGQGPLQHKVVAAAERAPSVEYLGHLENEQVLNIMQDALFLVFPSLLYENFPMTIVEAFASGLAVLASNLGNSANLIQPRRTGLHFTTGDPTDLAKQAAWLVNNRDELGKMRVLARENYEAQLTPEKNYRILSAIYRDTVAKREVGVQDGH